VDLILVEDFSGGNGSWKLSLEDAVAICLKINRVFGSANQAIVTSMIALLRNKYLNVSHREFEPLSYRLSTF
jgi:hypothetical protein